jgi:hypothetical protein
VRTIGWVLIALALSGCGGATTPGTPSTATQRDVAGRFATAILHGDADAARGLLLHQDESALVYLVDQAAAPWKTQHASIRRPVRRAGTRWTFRYAGTRTQKDGRFEMERGDLVVFLVPSAAGASVRFFGFEHVFTRFGTHHDAQLLPSNR